MDASKPNREVATHHGKFGDIVYAGPVLRAKNIRKLILFRDDFCGMTMTKESAEFIAPLLLNQQWCDSVVFREGDVPYSHLPGFRDHNPAHGSSLIGQHLSTYGLHDVVTHSEFPWITVTPSPVAKCVINRTPRWMEKRVDHRLNYKEIVEMAGGDAVFVGTDVEYEDFTDQVMDIPRQKVNNALELARVIAGAELFVGNPSLCAAIACGLRQTTVLECAHWFNAGWERPECAIMHNGSTMTSTHLDTLLEIGKIVKRRYWK